MSHGPGEQELIRAALELPRAQRSAFLRAAGKDDSEVARLEELLESRDREDESSTRGAPGLAGDVPSLEGRSLGHFRIVRFIAEGGMGVVYEAKQDNPRRRVALKLIRPGLASPDVLHRFDYEAQVLGRLQHPAIARIFEAGRAEIAGRSQPYFAMELIEGVPVTTYADAQRLSLAARIALVIRIAEGIDYAHRQGVIHRDLKPANILVDRSGQPQILDFGLARITDLEDEATSLRTQAGELLGTLSYMSPEQVSGNALAIDQRTDVYALGVLAYLLVSGKMPLELEGANLPKLARMICEEPPVPLGRLDRSWRGDLETVLEKALAKDKDHRYVSAEAFAADLQRFLNHEPIRARPHGRVYRARLFVRRHKAMAFAVIGILLASIAGAIVSARLAYLAEQRAEQALRAAYRGNMLAAGMALTSGLNDFARDTLEQTPQKLRGWEWRHFMSRLRPETRVLDHGVGVESVAISSDDRWLASSGAGKLRVWSAETGEAIFMKETGARDSRVEFSRGSDHVLVSGFIDLEARSEMRLRGFEVPSGREVRSFPLERFSGGLCFSPRRDRFAYWATSELRVCDPDTGRALCSRAVDSVIGPDDHLGFASDGRSIAMGRDRRPRVLDPETLEVLRVLGAGKVGSARLLVTSADDRFLASASDDRGLQLWRLDGSPEPKPPLSLIGHGARVNQAVFFGHSLASASNDGTVRIWDAETGETRFVLTGHSNVVTSLDVWNDGRRLVSGDISGRLRVFDLQLLEEPTVLRGHHSYVNPIALGPKGDWIVSGGWDGLVGEPGSIRFWDLQTGVEFGQIREPLITQYIDVSSDGLWVAAGTNRGVLLISARTGNVVARFPELKDASVVLFNLESSRLFCGRMTELTVIDVATRTITARQTIPEGAEPAAIRARDGALATRDRERKRAVLLDPASLEKIADLPAGWQAWHPEPGKSLLIRDQSIVLVDEDETVLHTTPLADPWNVRVSPDGSRIAVGSGSGRIFILESQTLSEVAQLTGHESYVYDLEFSADGETLVSSSGDGTIRIWETTPIPMRCEARYARQVAVQRLMPRVEQAFAEVGSAEEAVRRLESDESLAEADRRLALQLALGKGAGAQK